MLEKQIKKTGMTKSIIGVSVRDIRVLDKTQSHIEGVREAERMLADESGVVYGTEGLLAYRPTVRMLEDGSREVYETDMMLKGTKDSCETDQMIMENTQNSNTGDIGGSDIRILEDGIATDIGGTESTLETETTIPTDFSEAAMTLDNKSSNEFEDTESRILDHENRICETGGLLGKRNEIGGDTTSSPLLEERLCDGGHIEMKYVAKEHESPVITCNGNNDVKNKNPIVCDSEESTVATSGVSDHAEMSNLHKQLEYMDSKPEGFEQTKHEPIESGCVDTWDKNSVRSISQNSTCSIETRSFDSVDNDKETCSIETQCLYGESDQETCSIQTPCADENCGNCANDTCLIETPCGNIRRGRDTCWSWMVLLCVFVSQIVLGGICLNSGLFYVIFMEDIGSGSVSTAWLCSLPVTLWYMAPPVGSLLTNKYGYRVCVFIGGIIAATGLATSYFATSLPYLFVTYGFLTGFGFGISYMGGLAAVNAYFDKYKTIALGLASTGDNVGLIIYSSVIVLLEESYGWRGMILIAGALTLTICACAIFMAPVKDQKQERLKFEQVKAHTDGKDKPIKQKRSHVNLSVFKKSTYICFCCSNIFVSASIGVYSLHLPSYSTEAGFTENEFSTLWLVYGVANITGKIFFSFLGQHPNFNTTMLYTVSLGLTGISTCLTPLFLTKMGLLTTVGLVGFFYSVTGGLIQVVIYDIVGYNRFTDGSGMSMPFKAAGNQIGGPLAGVLLVSSGSYTSSFYLAGVSMIVGSIIMLHPIIYQIRHRRQKTKDVEGNHTVIVNPPVDSAYSSQEHVKLMVPTT